MIATPGQEKLLRFVACGVDELEHEIVRAVETRREQRRFGYAKRDVGPVLDPDALGSLVRVLRSKGLRTVRDLGPAAAVAWARRVGAA
jgi:hypothetical protein